MGRTAAIAIFFSFASLVTGGLHYYLWTRLVRDALWPTHVTRLLSVLAVALALLIPLAMVTSRALSGAAARGLAWVAYSWMGAMFLLFVSVGVLDLLRVFAVTATAADASRRQLFGRVVAVAGGALGLGLSVVSLRQALQALRIKHVEVFLDKLPPAFDGFVITQVSDIHVGPTIRRDFVEAMVRTIQETKPDLIAITGDLMDGSVAELGPEMEPLRRLITTAEHGVFFVTGNHEYYSGADEWIAFLRAMGVKVLRNSRTSITRGEAHFELAGIDDFTARPFGGDHGPDLPRALAGRSAQDAVVLLAHQPRAFPEAVAMGVDLQLSGHTHAGQIWPFGYAVRSQGPWVEGLYREGNAQIYVSPGTGYWGPPMRLGTQAEVTRIVLRSAERSA